MSSSAMNPPKHITTNGSRLRNQTEVARVAVTERDAHRYALNDFREVAGGIFGRDHAEDRPGPRRQALDVTLQDLPRQHIGDHRRRLPRPHMRELILLEIGVDPE